MKKFEGENMEAQYLFLDIGLICIFIIGSIDTTGYNEKSHKDCDIDYEI